MAIKKIARFLTLTSLFLIPFFPLFPLPAGIWPFSISNGFFFPFITGKAFYFRALVELAFASWVVLAFLEPKYRPRLNWITVAATLFTVVVLAADLLGVAPLRSLWSNSERMEGWMVIIHLWAFFTVISSVFTADAEGRRFWQRWMIVSLITAFVIACYGLLQLSGAAAIHQGSARVDASLGNSAYMAIYMMLNLFMAAWLYFSKNGLQKKHSWTGWLWSILSIPVVIELLSYLSHSYWHLSPVLLGLIFVVVAAVAIGFWRYQAMSVLLALLVLETQTRGTILGLLGAVVFALIIYAVFGKAESKGSRQGAAGIVIGIFVLGIVFLAIRHQPFIATNPILGRFSDISWNQASNQARQYIWPMALTGAGERPILGWGQENFNYVFNANYNPAMYAQEQWFDRAHSVYLDWLINAGVIGLLAYLALYVVFLAGVWKSSVSFREKCVLTALLAGYAVHNVFVFDNLASYVLFFAMLGYVSTIAPGGRKLFGEQPMRTDAVEYIVAPIAILAFAAALYFVDIRMVTANTRLIAAVSGCAQGNPDPAQFESALAVNSFAVNQEIREQLWQCGVQVIEAPQVPDQLKQAFYSLMTGEIRAQLAVSPKDARIYFLAAGALDQIGQYGDASSLLAMAHRLSPAKQTIDFELATNQMNTGKIADAVALLKQAYESAPDYSDARMAYASGLVVAGKEDTAHQVFHNDPAIFQTTRMAQIYLGIKQYAKAIAILKPLAAASPADLNTNVLLAQAQYLAGDNAGAVATITNLEKTHPEMKSQFDAAIDQINGKTTTK